MPYTSTHDQHWESNPKPWSWVQRSSSIYLTMHSHIILSISSSWTPFSLPDGVFWLCIAIYYCCISKKQWHWRYVMLLNEMSFKHFLTSQHALGYSWNPYVQIPHLSPKPQEVVMSDILYLHLESSTILHCTRSLPMQELRSHDLLYSTLQLPYKMNIKTYIFSHPNYSPDIFKQLQVLNDS